MVRGLGGPGNGKEQGTGALLFVLCTDIEGSTALTEQLGDELRVDALSAHDAGACWAARCTSPGALRRRRLRAVTDRS